MTADYSRYSPYNNNMLDDAQGNQNWHLSTYDLPSYIPDATDLTSYTIESKYHNRPWIKAKFDYGNERLYWIYALLNPELIDPLYDFTQGRTILIPTSEQVNRIISNK